MHQSLHTMTGAKADTLSGLMQAYLTRAIPATSIHDCLNSMKQTTRLLVTRALSYLMLS